MPCCAISPDDSSYLEIGTGFGNRGVFGKGYQHGGQRRFRPVCHIPPAERRTSRNIA